MYFLEHYKLGENETFFKVIDYKNWKENFKNCIGYLLIFDDIL